MVSSDVQQILEKLHDEQPTYKPNEAVLEKLHSVKAVCFVGGACMGKTTLMDALSAYAPEIYGKTRNFTSRPRRDDDDPKRYYYFEHTDEGLRPVIEQITAHELLQYNIDPFSWYVYGSHVDDYPHSHNLCDIWSTSIVGFRQLGFKELHVFSVITEPSAWQARFDARFTPEHPLRLPRLREAAESLRWSLGQTNPDHHWVISHDGQIDEAVQTVDTTLRKQSDTEQPEEARALAEACLARINEMCHG